MAEIRKEAGEARFSHALRVHLSERGTAGNPLETFDSLGYCTYKEQMRICGRLFADLNAVTLDVSRLNEGEPDGVWRSLEWRPADPMDPTPAGTFYMREIRGGQKVYFSPGSGADSESIEACEEVVFCAWPSKSEARRQFIVPFVYYYNFMSGYYVPAGEHWTLGQAPGLKELTPFA